MDIDVLIVDDDRLNRRLLRRYLEAEGFSTRVAVDGEQALELYAEKQPDVVLLDVVMPGIDGYETARRMKAQQQEQYVPILMLSALTSSESIALGLESGADDFLTKPYNRQNLNSRMQAALRTRRLFNSLAEKKVELQEMHQRERHDLMVAERVMAGLIRSDLLQSPFIKFRTTPASVFNGDLLMAESTPAGRLRVMLADFSGHGLVAAIGSQPVASIFRTMTQNGGATHRLLHAANQQLKAFLPPELFLAVCIVEIDPHAGILTVWNAGMPPVFVLGADGKLRTRIESTHVPLGIVDAMSFEQPSPIMLNDGDAVFLHSDGLTEAMNPTDEEFGEQRLLELFDQTPTLGSRVDALTRLHTEFLEGRPMVDDVTYVEIRQKRGIVLQDLEQHDATKPDFNLSVELGAKVLAEHEPAKILQAIMSELPILRDQPNAMLVLVELFNNAVDHGVLGLDSEVKQGRDGFEAYYKLRDTALRRLRDGRVKCEVEVRDTGNPEIVLRVEDSGPGFDVKNRRKWGAHTQSGPVPHGMGISLAQQLSRGLSYSDNGNRVEAIFDVSSSNEERS